MEEHTFVHRIGRAAAEPVPLLRPMGGVLVEAGFPSAAEDFMDGEIDLHEWLVTNQPATYYYRAAGWSMIYDGICDGDTLIVDNSVTVRDGDLVVAQWDGQAPVCKRIKMGNDRMELHSRNPRFEPIIVPAESQFLAFAVVGVCRKIIRGARRVRLG